MLSSKGNIYTEPFTHTPKLRLIAEEEVERVQEPATVIDYKETASSTYSRAATHVNSTVITIACANLCTSNPD